MAGRAALGRDGESAAASIYQARGYALLARNWRCPAGELDLVVARDGLLVFCEVKTRSGTAFGDGYEAVTPSKQRRLRRLAELFSFEHRLPLESVRFDVASVLLRSGATDVVIFEDAF